MIGRLRLLLAALLLALPMRSAVGQQIAFVSYGTDRGLLNTGFTCLGQDSTGFLLACTDNGLFRFDGQSFLRYDSNNTLPDRGVSHDLQVAPDGTLFVVDAGRLYAAADRPDPRFIPIAGPKQVDDDGSTRSALIGSDMLLATSGVLWIASRQPDGFERARHLLPDVLIRQYPALRTITAMAVSGDTVWLGCADGRLCRLECPRPRGKAGERSCTTVRVLGPEQGISAQAWIAMLVDRTGTLWARSADQLMSLPRDGDRATVDAVPGGVGRYAGRVFRLALALAPDGRIVTQGPSGLLIRDHGRWTEINRDHGLTDGEIGAMLFDRQGSLWLGLRGQGLFRAVGLGRWENWTTSDGLPDNLCWQLAKRPSGPLWVATDKGVASIGGASISSIGGASVSSIGGARVSSIGGAGVSATGGAGMGAVGGTDVVTSRLDGPSFAVAVTANGQVWSANLSGLLRRWSPRSGRIDVSFPTGSSDVMAIDRDGGLLLGTRDGLFRIASPDAASPAAPVLVPGTRGRVRVFAEDADGLIWLMRDAALVKVDPTGRRAPVEMVHRLGRQPRAMLFVAPDDLWLGSDEAGLEHLILSHGKPVRLATIPSPSLAASQISSFVKDRRGWVWVGSDHGLDIWNGRDWRQLGTQDGLLSNDLDEGSTLSDPDGSMWFGTGHGLSHLLDPTDLFSTKTLHPVISRVLLNGVPLSSRSIPWSNARLTVSFSDLDYAFGDRMRFRYRLDGVDRDWVETADTTVRYPTLPAGRLVFNVQAIDSTHQRSSDPASFTLTVRPPWWATLWFRVLAALLLLLSVAALVTLLSRLRVRLLLAQRRQLEELVAIRTREIAEAHAALQEQSQRDGLTGLFNRAAITDQLDRLLCRPDTRDQLAVAVADLDHFKSINDRYGHFGGDAVLRLLSSRVRQALRPGEFAGRYGGEELVLLLTGPDPAPMRLEQIRRAMLDGPAELEEQQVAVSCSFGLTRFRDGDNGETLLRRADRLLYRAKETGRDRIVSD